MLTVSSLCRSAKFLKTQFDASSFFSLVLCKSLKTQIVDTLDSGTAAGIWSYLRYDSRSNPFEERGYDAILSTILKEPLRVFNWSILRPKTKWIQDEVSRLSQEF